jgi:hypothetical protein
MSKAGDREEERRERQAGLSLSSLSLSLSRNSFALLLHLISLAGEERPLLVP